MVMMGKQILTIMYTIAACKNNFSPRRAILITCKLNETIKITIINLIEMSPSSASFLNFICDTLKACHTMSTISTILYAASDTLKQALSWQTPQSHGQPFYKVQNTNESKLAILHNNNSLNYSQPYVQLRYLRCCRFQIKL